MSPLPMSPINNILHFYGSSTTSNKHIDTLLTKVHDVFRFP